MSQLDVVGLPPSHTNQVACNSVGTWPGLCAVFVDFAANEVSASAGKKKGPDASIPKTLRRLVQLADDDRRSGVVSALTLLSELS